MGQSSGENERWEEKSEGKIRRKGRITMANLFPDDRDAKRRKQS